MKITPNRAKKANAMAAAAMLKCRSRNSDMSSRAWSGAQLAHDEADEEQHAPAVKALRTSGSVQPWDGRLDEPVDQDGDASDRQERARPVESRRGWVAAVGHEHDASTQGDEHDGHVDEEDSAPPEALDEQAADEGAKADADTRDTRPDGDRPGTLLLGEDVDDDGQGGGHDERGANTHGGARQDELACSSPTTRRRGWRGRR